MRGAGHAMRVSAMLHALLKLPRRADSASDGIRYPGVTDFDASHCLARGVLRLPRGGIARFLSSYDQLDVETASSMLPQNPLPALFRTFLFTGSVIWPWLVEPL